MEEFKDKTKYGALCIIVDLNGNIVLQQRDDKPGIFAPGKIGIFGGTGDSHEEPLNATMRELEEELEIKASPEDLELVIAYTAKTERHALDRPEFVYVMRGVDMSKTVLHEGTGIVLTKYSDFESINLCEGCKQILLDYQKKYG